jgi:hypothetical protein
MGVNGGLMGVKLHLAAYRTCHGRTAAALPEVWADASLQNSGGNTALDFAVVYRDPMTTQMSDIMLGYHNVNAIRQCTTGRPRDRGVHPSGGRGAAAVRRLCGARQRLAFATAMLPSAGGGLGEQPFDLLCPVPSRRGVGAARAGASARRVTCRRAGAAGASSNRR